MEEMTAPNSPKRIDHPLRVTGHETKATEFRLGKRVQRIMVRQYELEVPYLSMWRGAKVGRARLFVPRDAKEPIALIVAMHYELGLQGAAEYLAQGWAVMTPREGLNPFGDGVNLNLALLSACRQMPFVDQQRIGLLGASAGGYMTLMVASEAFPVTAAVAIAPIVSVPYEVEYFAKNITPARCGAKDEQGKGASSVPVFCLVAEAVKGFAAFLGPLRKRWRAWLRDSPVGVMSIVTSPVLAAFSTSDVLVPMDQVSDRFVIRAGDGVFPDGFEFDRRALVRAASAGTTFMQAVGRRAQVFVTKVPESLTPSWEQTDPEPSSVAHELPCKFSTGQPISVVILDEGAPDPRVGHFKYRFRYSVVPFFRSWFRRKTPLAPEQLTLRKLELLMRRFCGEDYEPMTGFRKPAGLAESLTRRNRASREKADVIAGLRAYCESGRAHRERLRALYRRLPASLRALNAGSARFDADVMGGLMYHEAMVHYSSGDRATAQHVARELLKDGQHQAYAACFPARLARVARCCPLTDD
jgi:dienelactone hydrolase